MPENVLVDRTDTDGSAWEYYEKIYGSRPDGKAFEFIFLSNSDGKYATLKNAPSNLADFEFRGDVIFNFKKGYNGQSRYEVFEKHLREIEDEKLKNDCLESLSVCLDKSQTNFNFSLFPSTGKMQQAKQGIGNDRGDTFIWALNQYYVNNVGILLNHSTQENIELLIDFLDLFKVDGAQKSIYKYCKEFYQIEDGKFIDKLLESGGKAIKSAEEAKNYIDLALEFWEKREAYFNQLNN